MPFHSSSITLIAAILNLPKAFRFIGFHPRPPRLARMAGVVAGRRKANNKSEKSCRSCQILIYYKDEFQTQKDTKTDIF
jgi:hypothetical protein